MFTDIPWPVKQNKPDKPIQGYGYYKGELVLILDSLTNSYSSKVELLVWYDSAIWVNATEVNSIIWYVA